MNSPRHHREIARRSVNNRCAPYMPLFPSCPIKLPNRFPATGTPSDQQAWLSQYRMTQRSKFVYSIICGRIDQLEGLTAVVVRQPRGGGISMKKTKKSSKMPRRHVQYINWLRQHTRKQILGWEEHTCTQVCSSKISSRDHSRTRFPHPGW